MHRKRNTVLALCLAAGVLLAAVLPRARASPDEGAAAPTWRYSLTLSAEQPSGTQADDLSTRFDLWVECSDPAGPALHTGTIALKCASSGTLTVLMADPYVGKGLDAGEFPTRDGDDALGFIWHVKDNTAAALDDAGRQKLAQVTISFGSHAASPDAVQVLPYVETALGAGQLAALRDASTPQAERDRLAALMADTWRWESQAAPAVGWYQGFYADDAGQVRVDVGTWSKLTVGCFDGRKEPAAPKPLTLLFYQGDTLAAKAEADLSGAARALNGWCKVPVDFAALTYTGADGTPLEKLPDGVYTIKLTKPGHVTGTITGAVFRDGSCPALLGRHMELPCGDLYWQGSRDDTLGFYLGDGHVDQQDRVRLLELLGADGTGGGDAAAWYADLDGDGRVTITDLDILMAPGNWNQGPATLDLGGEG